MPVDPSTENHLQGDQPAVTDQRCPDQQALRVTGPHDDPARIHPGVLRPVVRPQAIRRAGNDTKDNSPQEDENQIDQVSVVPEENGAPEEVACVGSELESLSDSKRLNKPARKEEWNGPPPSE